MNKVVIFGLLVTLIVARNYPMYKQCDPQWANDQLGTSTDTICKAGCLMSSAAMALSGTGHTYNPRTLNQWLKANGGYVSGDLFVWASINKLGLTFGGFISNSAIKSNLDAGKVVIVNVHNGGHWVLAHSYNGDSIQVNDPGYSTTAYSLGEIVNGNTGVYTVAKIPQWLNNWYYNVEDYLYSAFNIKRELIHAEKTSVETMEIYQQ